MNYDSIRTRFDEILRDNIRRLLDTMPEAASLPFDIVTITSLIMLVEKEKEIKGFPNAGSGRYSESTLLENLADTGLNTGEDSRASIQNLQGMGFVTIDIDGRLVPRESTAKLVAVLDNLFPGMPGMNLVAYFLQTVQEAASGRKEIDQAVRQFEQTLSSRGVSLSKSNQPKEKASGTENGGKPPDKIDCSRQVSNRTSNRISNLERLRRIRSCQISRSAEISSVRPLTELKKVEIVSLFPKPNPLSGVCEVSIPPPSAQPEGTEDDRTDQIHPIEDGVDEGERSEIAASDPSDGISDQTAIEAATERAEAEGNSVESALAGPDADAVSSDIGSDSARQSDHGPSKGDAESCPQQPAPDARREDRPMALETGSAGIVPDEPIESVDFEADAVAKEEVVDLHVMQFQQKLAMTCPLCRKGCIHPSKTDKGKIYYSCENRDCNFISWGKPYHFSCPYCRNPFLIEYSSPDGPAGLKCPKATCNYRQGHLNSPASDAAPPVISSATGSAPGKGKVLVRKRLVRRKR